MTLGRLRGVRGSMLVGGAITLAAFALLGSALIEVGQWYEHQRNLRTRTDAAAFAGGDLFNECFDSSFTSAQAAADMEKAAVQYSGIPGQVSIGGTNVSSTYNKAWQAGTPGNDGIGFQSNEYPTPGGSLPTRDAFGANSDECSTLEFDVKQSQQVPNLFPFSPLSVAHGWARVELQTILAEKPSVPLAIPNFDLSHLGVTFVDETTGQELTGCTGALVAGTTCTYELPKPTAAVGQDGESVSMWTLSPVGINLPAPSTSDGDLIGVRVSAGSAVGSCANSQGTNTYSCVDITQTGSGLVGIRDYPTSNQTTPALYEVLPSNSCSSDTSPFFSDLTGQSSCGVTLQARIGNGCGSNPETSSPNASVTATMPNALDAKNPYTITLHAVAGTCNANGWLWSGTTTLPIDSNSGASEYPVTLTYKAGGTQHTWTNVQRFTSGNLDDDGPVRGISLSSASGNPYSATPGIDNVGVTVVTSQAGISKQLIVLRGSHNGSSTAFILCYDKGSGSPYSPEQGDPGIEDGMQNGCSFSYGINPTLTCPDPGGAQPLPADCIPNKTSAAGGNPLVSKPLNTRFGCSNSPPTYPNNWPNFSIPGDKRAVTLVLTSYNAYANGGKQNGSQSYPVEGFGNFYITGYTGDNCPVGKTPGTPGMDDPPPPEAAADGPNSGDIWGYFIQYAVGGAIPSGRKCQANTFGTCVPALVR